MSDKENFSIGVDLISDSDGVSGQITSALKLASEYRDDFIRFVKKVLAQNTPTDGSPKLEDLIVGGRLRYNIIADFGGVKLFLAKGIGAKYKSGVLEVKGVLLRIGGTLELQWRMKKNDFNADEICAYISPKKA